MKLVPEKFAIGMYDTPGITFVSGKAVTPICLNTKKILLPTFNDQL